MVDVFKDDEIPTEDESIKSVNVEEDEETKNSNYISPDDKRRKQYKSEIVHIK